MFLYALLTRVNLITDIQNVQNEYTGFSFPKSVYFDIQASTYHVLLHEVGHNLGQAHSGKDGASYGDRTCWMGAHTYWYALSLLLDIYS